MSNENQPNQDHWKDLIKSLDLDVEFDDDTLDTGGKPETSEPAQEEMPREEEASCEAAPSEELTTPETNETPEASASSSKVDPLFDLGWNIPEEPKTPEKQAAKETPEAKLPKKPVVEKPKSELPKKPKKKPVSRGFGFGLLPDEPEEEPAQPEEEPAVSDQIEETPVFEEPVEELALEVSLDGGIEDRDIKEDDSEGASDWMALAAQLGVPIRSESELEAKEASASKPVAAEEEPVETEQAETDEEYDPLAAWGAPVPAARKPREEKPSRRKPAVADSREATEAEATQQEEPVIIGKPKDESNEPKKERGRRRGRGRGRRRERDADSVEIIEEEEVVSTSASLDVELFGEEAESPEERPSKERRRRRRPRRGRKPTAAEPTDSEPLEDIDIDLDTDVFDEDDEVHGTTSKSHRGIPSWEEAIGLVVDKNLGARSNRSDDSRSSRPRGGRGRSGRRGGRSKE